jgi:hypothetical protein
MLNWNWQQTEFVLKGVYLGLLVMIACFRPTRDEGALIALFALAGLLLFLGTAGVRKIREGFKVKGQWVGFGIFLVLENPGMVYAGLLVGLSGGAVWTFKWWRAQDGVPAEMPVESLWPVLGGAVLGLIFYGLRHVRQRLYRFYIGLAMVAFLVGGAAAIFHFTPGLLTVDMKTMGTLLLLGIPGFYLLTFAGMVEESEIESPPCAPRWASACGRICRKSARRWGAPSSFCPWRSSSSTQRAGCRGFACSSTPCAE